MRPTAQLHEVRRVRFLMLAFSLHERYYIKLLGKDIIRYSAGRTAIPNSAGQPDAYVRHFDHFLKSRDDSGVVIADSRRKAQNREAAHSIFTQLHERDGSAFPSLPQDIAFSPSNNSAMIQMADIVCSALVFSMMADAYNLHLFEAGNIHNCPAYFHVRMRYKDRVKRLQNMRKEDGPWQGGQSVWDMTGLRRNGSLLFRDLLLPALPG